MSRDQKFFDMYSLVIGVLVIVALIILVVSSGMANRTQGVYSREVPEYKERLAARIRPLGQVYLGGETPESTASSAQIDAAPDGVATAMSGPEVYDAACIICHGPGLAGAPVFGDTAVWATRIAQGSDTLIEHALQGFSGSTGVMPPKGGRIDLSDAEIESAVDYMLDGSQ